jgi:hypothetical protein
MRISVTAQDFIKVEIPAHADFQHRSITLADSTVLSSMDKPAFIPVHSAASIMVASPGASPTADMQALEADSTAAGSTAVAVTQEAIGNASQSQPAQRMTANVTFHPTQQSYLH